jgi:two-component system phosphate regulon response regulator PhoB
MSDASPGRSRPLVLLAEDDPDVRDMIERKLRGDDMDVIAVSDGVAALHAAKTMRPDLVLLDVMMPGMTGLQICHELRSNVATNNLPVMLITARARAEDIQTGYDAGADDYIVKPFSPRDLVTRIRDGLVAVRR